MGKEIVRRVIDYIKNMENPKENMLEILLVSQKEAGGIIPTWLQQELADILDVDLEEIGDTIEFFPFLREKIEKQKVELCMGTSCYMGGNSINQGILKEISDDSFDIIHRECEEACEYGPRIIVGHKTFQFVTEEDISEIISYVKEEK